VCVFSSASSFFLQGAQSQRKLLAESTKEFRKMTDAEKIVTVKDLIKAYQTEIDTLTKRARMSDGAFFALYKVCVCVCCVCAE
jgi:hypothetical protein